MPLCDNPRLTFISDPIRSTPGAPQRGARASSTKRARARPLSYPEKYHISMRAAAAVAVLLAAHASAALGPEGTELGELGVDPETLAAVPPAVLAVVGALVDHAGEMVRGEMDAMRGEMRALRADNSELSRRLGSLERVESECNRTAGGGEAAAGPAAPPHAAARRRAQSPVGESVRIIKPQVVRCGQPSADGIPRADVCDAGHRRAQADDSCDADELAWRMDGINSACCDDPSEDCSGGYPTTCNTDCATLFLAFWDECRSALGKSSRNYEPVVAMCEAVVSATPPLAQQLNVACSDGTAAADCVPPCSEDLHGDLLLLDIEGHDSKFACELRHGLYSWVGPAVRARPPYRSGRPVAACCCVPLSLPRCGVRVSSRRSFLI